MVGANMRLRANAAREMHWHKEGEWSYVLKGRTRITAMDGNGRTFLADVGRATYGVPQGHPALDPGLGQRYRRRRVPAGVRRWRVSEDSAFLITDWLAHRPEDVLAKNFGVSEDALANLPSKERYIFPAAPA